MFIAARICYPSPTKLEGIISFTKHPTKQQATSNIIYSSSNSSTAFLPSAQSSVTAILPSAHAATQTESSCPKTKITPWPQVPNEAANRTIKLT
uniref:Uncharacterized protein n=1 Tax=Oryza brachyantha TaxID=4533 RepID=J3L960_ORYBR